MTGNATGPEVGAGQDYSALTDDQVARIRDAIQPDIRSILRLFGCPVPDGPGLLVIPDEVLNAGAWWLYGAALREAAERVIAEDAESAAAAEDALGETG